MSSAVKVHRRDFFRIGAAGAAGLVVGFYAPPAAGQAAGEVTLTPWVHIGTNELVTLFVHKSEMGQGTFTSLPMLLAEELECDWSKVRPAFAPVDRAYGLQGVFGSNSIRSSWNPLRQAGAAAREMLMEAAAKRWGVDRAGLRAENGFVINTASNARLSYGSLVEDASKLTPPGSVKLKDPKDFKIIGKPTKRLDTPDKVRGTSEFGLDVRVPGMVYASVERCPVLGGKVASFDATKAKAIPGVKDAVQISSGVAVIADNTWAAMQGRKALSVKWDEGPNTSVTSAGLRQQRAELAAQPGLEARKVGDAAAAMATAAKKIEAVYEAPYLAHATMEPMNCTAHVRADACDVWAPTQFQTQVQQTAMRITGLGPAAVKVHTTMLGGGFGRRAAVDFVNDAVETSKAIGAPVKVTWTREDDMRFDSYRPASYCKFAAGFDASGNPVALTSSIACPPIMGGGGGRGRGGAPRVDGASVEGVADAPYTVPNILVDWRGVDAPVPVTFWRSVGFSQNTFFAEGFVDEMAEAAGKDPVEFRRMLLKESPRHAGVLEVVAKESAWGTALPAGRARGVAVTRAFGTYSAQVAEVSIEGGKVKVHRVVAAVDCGRAVNPSTVVAQVQSAIVYGLSAAMKGEITIEGGKVQQGNFDRYDVVRMSEMPHIEVHIVASEEDPTGIGEPGTPPIAPAVCNALHVLTKKRIRQLPIRAADLA